MERMDAMNFRRMASVSACVLALMCGASALADALPEATAIPAAEEVQQVPCSTGGGQIIDTGDKYYIAISELPACADGSVLVYDKASGELATLATASNISQLVYADDAVYALTPTMDGVCLIRITDKCEALTTAGVIDQLSVYEGKLYFLADGKLTSVNPDGSELSTLSGLNMGQYVISDGVVYFTNMDDTRKYTVNSKLQSEPLSLTAGCLYSMDLTTGVQVKLLSEGVKSIKALGGEIYLQYMGESYVTTIGDTEQPTGRLFRFDPATRKLEREAVQNEYSYFPTPAGLIAHVDYDLALYSNDVYSMSLYNPEQGASVYRTDDCGVMVYEPIAQRLTYVSADLNVDNVVIYSNGDVPDNVYTRPTMSPISTAVAGQTPAPTVKPVVRPTSSPKLEGIIFPDSDTRRLTEKEIRALDDSQLIYARYEILARNGYVFNDTKYLKYYRQFDWYVEDPSFKFGDLDTIESYNYELLRAIMNEVFATPTPKPTVKPTVRPTPVYSTDFIFPNSSLEKLTRKQVLALDTDDLLEARYEILARNGYVFETKSWQRYFEKKSWYSPDKSFKFGDMTSIESYNYELIRAIDKEISATPAPTSVPGEYAFIFPDALDRKLTRAEVLAVDADELLKARYEILARKGYVFDTKSWQSYFEAQYWYAPNSSFEFGDMNETESYNYELIRAIDKEIHGEATEAPTTAPTEAPDKPTPPPAATESPAHPTPPSPTDPADAVLLIDSDKYEYSVGDIMALDASLHTPDMLMLIRDEILARHGYVFDTSTEEGALADAYFRKLNWYAPDSSFDPTAEGALNKFELANYELMNRIIAGEYGDPLEWEEAVG